MSDHGTVRELKSDEIRERAHDLGYTIVSLAEALPMNRSALHRALTSRRASEDTQQRLALVLECEIADITEPTELEAALKLINTMQQLLGPT